MAHADNAAGAAQAAARGGSGVGVVANSAVRVGQQAEPHVRGLLESSKTQLHHIFPQHFRTWFANRGIDIDNYAVSLERVTHLTGIHGRGGFVGPGNVLLPGKWNARWKAFIQQNPNATAKEIYQYAGQLMDEFGLNRLPIVPYK